MKKGKKKKSPRASHPTARTACWACFLAGIIFSGVFFPSPTAENTGYRDERVLEIYQRIFTLSRENEYLRIPPLLDKLARLQSNDSRDCLVDLLDFNFPPSVSLRLYQQITALGIAMINHLDRKLYMDPPREYSRELVAWKKRVQEQAKLLVNAINCGVIIWAGEPPDPKWAAVRDLFLIKYHLDKFRTFKSQYPTELRFVDFVHRNVDHFSGDGTTEIWLGLGLPIPPRDPWGTDYFFRSSPDGTAYMLSSAGPDREHRTGDDVQLICRR